MKGSNNSRDFFRNSSGGSSTPVTYRSTAAVYRSLAAVPAQFEVEKHATRAEKQFTPLVGPQNKGQGEVVWTEQKQSWGEKKNTQPLPIPLIVANAPHNTVYLESNPVCKVVSAVHGLFEQHNVDFDFIGDKFKWKCACYDAQVETKFVSRLFSIPDKANYFVLDFQRRSGDPFHFQSIYKSINFKLLKSGFVVPCGDNKAAIEPEIRTFRPLALPDDFHASEDEEDVKDLSDYEPLCKMCLSPYIDVQREGLTALANHVETSKTARDILAPFTEKLLEVVLFSRDTQVRRLALSALAGLMVNPATHLQIKEKGGLKVFVTILLNEHELMETRRKACNVLQRVSAWDADTINSLRRANIAPNARLGQLMKDLQSRLL